VPLASRASPGRTVAISSATVSNLLFISVLVS
jgi:hypothetical protein